MTPPPSLTCTLMYFGFMTDSTRYGTPDNNNNLPPVSPQFQIWESCQTTTARNPDRSDNSGLTPLTPAIKSASVSPLPINSRYNALLTRAI